MNSLVKASVLAVVVLSPASARASLTVTPGLTVHNKCGQHISVAVRYKASSGHWSTTPFTGISAREQKNGIAYSNNSIFHYYAEGAGRRWSGDHNVRVGQKLYPMRRLDDLGHGWPAFSR
jgi:uncharacterized membrane protein